ncbi:hypothetical protein [Azospirillum canadense]|uniref:hypothetical protein n=1 Tax=Azospirillum canadense TaxID=403962 RepID=UPI002227C3E5|nr:hypothetical protein [Azospirillum canadense]MCW2236714.1 hypothetical protein [Azospirillum canadense]
MRRARSGRTAVRVAALLLPIALLPACQATNSPPLPRAAVPTAFVRPSDSGLSDAPGRVVAQNKGWVVRAHPATQTGSAYCLATRADSASPLSFRATAKGAAMLVNGDQKAQPPTGERAGESRLTAIFPDGASMALEAKPLPNGGVIVPVELPKYEDLFEPFMRSKAVTLKSADADKIGDVSLGGSSWALNALDECRILHTDGQFAEAAPRPAQP